MEFIFLPPEVVAYILVETKISDINRMSSVCQTIKTICEDESFWRNKVEKDFPCAPRPKKGFWRQHYRKLFQKIIPILIPAKEESWEDIYITLQVDDSYEQLLARIAGLRSQVAWSKMAVLCETKVWFLSLSSASSSIWNMINKQEVRAIKYILTETFDPEGIIGITYDGTVVGTIWFHTTLTRSWENIILGLAERHTDYFMYGAAGYHYFHWKNYQGLGRIDIPHIALSITIPEKLGTCEACEYPGTMVEYLSELNAHILRELKTYPHIQDLIKFSPLQGEENFRPVFWLHIKSNYKIPGRV